LDEPGGKAVPKGRYLHDHHLSPDGQSWVTVLLSRMTMNPYVRCIVRDSLASSAWSTRRDEDDEAEAEVEVDQ
jgi:hypothetical protein